MRANVGFDLECDAFDGDWQRVSGTTPCPVCGGLEDCRTHVEEAFACCLRRPSDWRLDNGGWLHRITVPTLIMWGKEDKLFPSAYAARWGERIPGSRVEIVPECGHVPAVEKPEITAKEIIRLYAGTR